MGDGWSILNSSKIRWAHRDMDLASTVYSKQKKKKFMYIRAVKHLSYASHMPIRKIIKHLLPARLAPTRTSARLARTYTDAAHGARLPAGSRTTPGNDFSSLNRASLCPIERFLDLDSTSTHIGRRTSK